MLFKLSRGDKQAKQLRRLTLAPVPANALVFTSQQWCVSQMHTQSFCDKHDTRLIVMAAVISMERQISLLQ